MTAIAASMALPPSRNTSTPTSEAIGWSRRHRAVAEGDRRGVADGDGERLGDRRGTPDRRRRAAASGQEDHRRDPQRQQALEERSSIQRLVEPGKHQSTIVDPGSRPADRVQPGHERSVAIPGPVDPARREVWNRGFCSLMVMQFAGAMNDNILRGLISVSVATEIWAATAGSLGGHPGGRALPRRSPSCCSPGGGTDRGSLLQALDDDRPEAGRPRWRSSRWSPSCWAA